VRKVIEGREAEIRPCVGATYCLDRIYQGGMALCIHNPATGREVDGIPHDIPPAEVRRRVVVVGAGPAGLEAARVAALRGHMVTLFEAADQPGGQIRLLSLQKRRAEMIGIVDWRMAECTRAGVDVRFNTWAEAEDVLALSPDVVVVATGGLPDGLPIPGGELAVTAWDILSGDVRPQGQVLLYDDAGDHAAMQAAQALAEAGAQVEIVTRDRTFAPEVMGMNLAPYMAALQAKGAVFTVTWRLDAVARDGNRLRAALGSDYGTARQDRHVDQVVVNHGTRPNDDIYHALRPLSANRGAVDHDRLIAGQPQEMGGMRLFRVGDAVSARNIHAGIYDSLRLLKDI
jgi:N-methyl-L-proline demethylase